MSTTGTPLRMKPKGPGAKKPTHEKLQSDYEQFLSAGGVVTELPGFTQSIKARAAVVRMGKGPQ